MFWTVMLITDAVCCLAYGFVSVRGRRWGISEYRLGLVRRSSWLLLAWTALSLANVLRHH
jgi:hypothetical protein